MTNHPERWHSKSNPDYNRECPCERSSREQRVPEYAKPLSWNGPVSRNLGRLARFPRAVPRTGCADALSINCRRITSPASRSSSRSWSSQRTPKSTGFPTFRSLRLARAPWAVQRRPRCQLWSLNSSLSSQRLLRTSRSVGSRSVAGRTGRRSLLSSYSLPPTNPARATRITYTSGFR